MAPHDLYYVLESLSTYSGVYFRHWETSCSRFWPANMKDYLKPNTYSPNLNAELLIYRGQLQTGKVWYSGHGHLSGIEMVLYSGHKDHLSSKM